MQQEFYRVAIALSQVFIRLGVRLGMKKHMRTNLTLMQETQSAMFCGFQMQMVLVG